jgi:hypothetical protein
MLIQQNNMPLPIKHDIDYLYQGDDFSGIKYQMYDVDDVPSDFTGATAKMQVRINSEEDVVLEWNTSDNSIVITGNEVFVKEKAGIDMDIPAGKYKYDLQLTYSDGVISTIVYGLFIVKSDITKDA